MEQRFNPHADGEAVERRSATERRRSGNRLFQMRARHVGSLDRRQDAAGWARLGAIARRLRARMRQIG
jgi:hypothetical protein